MASKTDSDLKKSNFIRLIEQVLSDKRPTDSLGQLLEKNDDYVSLGA